MVHGIMNDSLRTLLDLLVALYREEYFVKKMWRKVYGFRDLPDEYIAVAFACNRLYERDIFVRPGPSGFEFKDRKEVKEYLDLYRQVFYEYAAWKNKEKLCEN